MIPLLSVCSIFIGGWLLTRIASSKLAGVLYISAAPLWLGLESPLIIMLAFGLAAVDSARCGRWGWAGAHAGVAAIVDPVGGFVLIGVLLIVALRSDEAWRRYLRFVIVPAAIAVLLAFMVSRTSLSAWAFGLPFLLPLGIAGLFGWGKAQRDPLITAIVAWGLFTIIARAMALQVAVLVLIPGLAVLAAYGQHPFGRAVALLTPPLHLIMLVLALVVPHAIHLGSTSTRTELRLIITDMRIVPANLDYGRDLKLVGVALDQVAIPGRDIRVRLDWRLAKFPMADLKLNIALLNRENLPIVSTEEIVPVGRWQQVHVVTEHTVSVPEQPPGAIKAFVTVNYQAARLGAQTVGRVIVPVGPRPTDAPQIARLGDTGSTLLAPTITVQGEALHVILRWRAAGPLDRDYKFFLHVQDGPQNILAQIDAEPQVGNYPTSLWQTGDVVIDSGIVLDLSKVPAGRHMLQFGMYGENARLTFRPCQGQPTDSIQLATIVIAADRTISVESQMASC